MARRRLCLCRARGCGIRRLQNRGSDRAPPGNRRFAYYVDVGEVDALYAEFKPKLDAFSAAACSELDFRVHGPADKPYNQRELLIVAPDGNLIAFGQSLS